MTTVWHISYILHLPFFPLTVYYFLCITCTAEDSGTHRRTDVREQREDGGRKKDTAGQTTETWLNNTAGQIRLKDLADFCVWYQFNQFNSLDLSLTENRKHTHWHKQTHWHTHTDTHTDTHSVRITAIVEKEPQISKADLRSSSLVQWHAL